jgi:hypothetical protein
MRLFLKWGFSNLPGQCLPLRLLCSSCSVEGKVSFCWHLKFVFKEVHNRSPYGDRADKALNECPQIVVASASGASTVHSSLYLHFLEWPGQLAMSPPSLVLFLDYCSHAMCSGKILLRVDPRTQVLAKGEALALSTFWNSNVILSWNLPRLIHKDGSPPWCTFCNFQDTARLFFFFKLFVVVVVLSLQKHNKSVSWFHTTRFTSHKIPWLLSFLNQ